MNSKKKTPVVVGATIGMMSVVFLLYVWGKVDLVRVGYELDVLSKQKSALLRENEQLQLDLSRLTAPNRIALVASERLGLRAPGPEQIVVVSVPASADSNHLAQSEHDRLVTVAQNLPERP